MKIAICFFGITRNLKNHTLDSIERNLLRPVAEKDAACRKFAHFNLVPHVSNPRSGEENVPVDTSDFKLLKCDIVSHTDQTWLDGLLDYEGIQKFGDWQGDNFVSLRNLVRQLYSLKEVTGILLRANEQFDLVIYSRADLRFERKVEIPKIRPGTVYTPWFDKYRGLNDRFAMGDFATMIKYGQRYSMIQQYCQETGHPLHAERFLLWYSKKQGLRNVDLTSIDFCRVRANGKAVIVDTSAGARLKYRFKKALRILRLRSS